MAVRVGILSDTHGMLFDEVVEILKTCDYIIHAGDFDRERILDQIRFLGNLYVVRGNSDGSWAQDLSDRQRFRIEDLEFFVMHEPMKAQRYAGDADIVIYGHTHVYAENQFDGKLWLNPGSCSLPRGGDQASIAVMEVDGKNYKVERVLI